MSEQLGHGFAPDTLITTDLGDLPIAWITAGDLVLTRDGGFQPVESVLRQQQRGSEPVHSVTIAQGALGDGLPTEATTLSGHHRVLLSGAQLELYFGTREALIEACELDWPGIERIETIGVNCNITEQLVAAGRRLRRTHGRTAHPTEQRACVCEQRKRR
jgi:hypothetical protein